MKYTYSDMKHGLDIGNNGSAEIVHDEKCIRQSIMTIFSTVALERVRNPIGSGLIKLLFQPVNNVTASRIRNELVGVIERWEPRVTVTRFVVTADIDAHTYDVDITYTINKIGKEYNLRTGLRSFS